MHTGRNIGTDREPRILSPWFWSSSLFEGTAVTGVRGSTVARIGTSTVAGKVSAVFGFVNGQYSVHLGCEGLVDSQCPIMTCNTPVVASFGSASPAFGYKDGSRRHVIGIRGDGTSRFVSGLASGLFALAKFLFCGRDSVFFQAQRRKATEGFRVIGLNVVVRVHDVCSIGRQRKHVSHVFGYIINVHVFKEEGRVFFCDGVIQV
mmetsp:Transcript_9251/g.22986  ORF Transcript_9251/g.22986 Transcript_9251/m.22986 type:complete len:205 (-) Transcript_9251:672-1286(-)